MVSFDTKNRVRIDILRVNKVDCSEPAFNDIMTLRPQQQTHQALLDLSSTTTNTKREALRTITIHDTCSHFPIQNHINT